MGKKASRKYLINLMHIQAREFTYEEFLMVLKNRLRRFYGRDEVMFYNEIQLANLMGESISYDSPVKS